MNNCFLKVSKSYKNSYKFLLGCFVNFDPVLNAFVLSEKNAYDISFFHCNNKKNFEEENALVLLIDMRMSFKKGRSC